MKVRVPPCNKSNFNLSTPILVLFLLKTPCLFSLAAPSTPSLPIIVTNSLSLARAGLGWAGCSICPGKMWRKCGFVPGIATYWESLRRSWLVSTLSTTVKTDVSLEEMLLTLWMSQDIHNMFAIVIPVESGTPFMLLLRNVCMEFSFSFFLLGDILFNHGNKNKTCFIYKSVST